jgi:hypothetical protein
MVHISVFVLVIMDCKLYAVVDLRAVLGAKIRVEVHASREGDGGAVKGLFIQDDETFDVVQIRNRHQQLLVPGEDAEIIIEGSHPRHLYIFNSKSCSVVIIADIRVLTYTTNAVIVVVIRMTY